ncbi:MAG: SIS domain-containing protein [Pseudomonadota bacterium]
MCATKTQMRREIEEIPAAVERLIAKGSPGIAKAAARARALDPRFAVTVARGSSDHIATYLKYASELLLGLPVASVGPSVASIYGARLKLAGSLCLSVSQSGKSPDIVAMANAARRDGALTLALTNVPDSPLAEASEEVIDICAGPELSVAATKTFVTSAVAGLLLFAEWTEEKELSKSIRRLPEDLEKAVSIDWSPMQEAVRGQQSLFTLGRGPAWAMSNEAALKFKETCQIHAESYSSAEVLHGPVSIVGEGFPVLCLASRDASKDAVVAVADALADKGAAAFVTSEAPQVAHVLPCARTAHPLTDPLALITSFYVLVDNVAADRGIDPDTPRHLKKVTETI